MKPLKAALARYGLVAAFLLFLCWVIFAADTGTFPPLIRNVYRFPHGDWLAHFLLYGLLAWLAARALRRRVSFFRWQLPLSALLVLLMAVLEELSQFWFPRRTPDLADLSLGLLGIIAGTWLAIWRK